MDLVFHLVWQREAHKSSNIFLHIIVCTFLNLEHAASKQNNGNGVQEANTFMHSRLPIQVPYVVHMWYIQPHTSKCPFTQALLKIREKMSLRPRQHSKPIMHQWWKLRKDVLMNLNLKAELDIQKPNSCIRPMYTLENQNLWFLSCI